MRMFSLLFALFISVSTQQVFATKKDKKEEVKKEIENKNYTIDVNRALPMQGNMRNLTSAYSITIKNDSVFSYLPYFGRAYSAPYGGGKGLNFEEVVYDYNVTFDKKGTAKIKFHTRTEEDKYSFSIVIFSNGASTINVTPVQKQSITFHGDLKLVNDSEQ